MSQLILISDGCWIDPDLVAEVKTNDLSGTLTVRMRDGIGHTVQADYGKSIYSTATRLITDLNAARTE